jgi:hypothetical protein
MEPSTAIDFASFRSPVLEKHVDFILEEEFSCNSKFLSFFIALAQSYVRSDAEALNEMPSPHETSWLHTARSITAGKGETDVLVLYEDIDQNRVAILIEDKVRAGFQDAQPERYRERGEEGKVAGHWKHFWTCLVAPAGYGSGNEGFDARISVEDLLKFFHGKDPRTIFRAKVLEGALEHFHNKGVQNPAKTLTEFRKLYAATAQNRFSGTAIGWTPAREAWSDDTWFRFPCADLPRGAYIEHRAPAGRVHLTFPNTSLERLKQVFEQTSDISGISAVSTNKSSSLQIVVNTITDFSNFPAQEAALTQAFNAVERLHTLWQDQLNSFAFLDRSGLNLKKQTCLLLATTADAQRVMGQITLNGNKLLANQMGSGNNPDFENEILGPTITVGTRTFKAQSDPVGWFEHLPYLYNGAYLRAVLLKDPPRY